MAPEIVQWVQTVAVTLVAAIVVLAAWRLSRWAAGQAQDALVVKLVRAAEQMLPGATGAEKLAWVLEQVGELLPGVDIDEALLRVLVESEVQQMNEVKGVPLAPALELSETGAEIGQRIFVTSVVPPDAPD